MRKKKDYLESIDTQLQLSLFREKTGQNFETVYTKQLPKLTYHISKYFGGDQQAAQDSAVDSMLKSLSMISTYNKDLSRLSTWLYTIAKNDAIQAQNKNKLFMSMDKVLNEDGITLGDTIPSETISDIYEKENDELISKKGSIIIDKIQRLPEPFRNVLTLREIEHKTYREMTIILREEKELFIGTNMFDIEAKYNKESRILTLSDQEEAVANPDIYLTKFYEIFNIEDEDGLPVNYTVLGRDKDGLIERIILPYGEYTIYGVAPFNMSTLKSQIRNGRLRIQEMVSEEFELLEYQYIN